MKPKPEDEPQPAPAPKVSITCRECGRVVWQTDVNAQGKCCDCGEGTR